MIENLCWYGKQWYWWIGSFKTF